LTLNTPRSHLFPYTTLFRSEGQIGASQDREESVADRLVYVSRLVHLPLLGADEAEIGRMADVVLGAPAHEAPPVHGFVVAVQRRDRKSTRLNSSHRTISYAV